MQIENHGFNLTELEKSIISFFSEGNSYYSTFKPLVDSFLKKQIKINYYTLDSNDKILKIKNKYLKSKYLGFKYLAYFRFALIECDYLISTTPNIGNLNYPLKKPKMVKNLVHIFHSVSDISIYREGSLDFYDSVILTGEFQKKSIREIEKVRNLKPKKLIPLGVPYIDYLIQKKDNTNNNRKTILIGSSWGDKGCLKNYGFEYIRKLSEENYNIIIRPHPYSMKIEKKFILNLKKKLEKIKNIKWDESINPSKSMNESDILISDTSSLRFDFLLIHKKPVITLEIKKNDMLGYERKHLPENWTDTSNFEIGPVITKKTIGQINDKILLLLNNFDRTKIDNYISKTIYNFGTGSDSIANYFEKLQTN